MNAEPGITLDLFCSHKTQARSTEARAVTLFIASGFEIEIFGVWFYLGIKAFVLNFLIKDVVLIKNKAKSNIKCSGHYLVTVC